MTNPSNPKPPELKPSDSRKEVVGGGSLSPTTEAGGSGVRSPSPKAEPPDPTD